MSENRLNRLPELKRRLSLPFITGSIAVMLVMVALPVSQMVSGTPDVRLPDLDATPYERPPDVIQDDPEVEDPEEIDEPELVDDPEPPDLNTIETMYDPDLDRFGNSDYRIQVRGSQDSIDDIVHTLADLSRRPRPIRQAQPVYPSNLKNAGIEGEVVLTFIVRADGTTSNIKAMRSSNPGFESPAIKTVRKWIFQPGEKDGKAVNTIVRIEIPFRINSGL